MKKRLLSALLVLTMALSMVPFGALAEDVTEPVETTVATETTEATEETKATETTVAMEVDETTEPTAVTKATETAEPSEPTAVEKVQSLIDALPETVTAENRAEVEAQLTAIDEAKLPLTEEERDALDFGKYNAAIAALNELDDMAGAEVPETLDALEYITVVGGSNENWLHDEDWYPYSEANRMAQVLSGVWEITYTGVSACDGYQFKFITNGGWKDNWGSEDGTAGSTTAVYNGKNICFAVTGDGSTVKLVLDLRTYDAESHSGAAYYIYVNGVQINGSVVGYEVTFAPDGGTLPEGVANTAITDATGKLTTLPTPTKSGCAFLGWYNGETKWDTTMAATGNMTLTAKWSDGTNVESEEELKACVEAGISPIKLGDDITLSETLVIPEGKNITLEMNSYISGSSLQSSAKYTIEVKGNLTVEVKGDLTSTKARIDNTSTSGDAVAVRVNGGTFTLNSGDISASGTGSDAVRVSSGTFTMNGGIISGGARSVYIHKGAVMNANGGTATGGLRNRGTIQTTSGDGTIFTNGKAINDTALDTNGNNWNGVVKGGNFEKTNRDGIYKVTFLDGETTVATQYRGNACADALDYDKEGYTVKWYDGDTQWDFSQKVTKDMILKTKFEATVTTEAQLKEALAAGITDIKLDADITLGEDLCITEQDWNLDLNGHTLSGGQIKFSTGKMTVTDSVGGGSVNNSITLTNATLSGTVFKGYVNCVVNSTINGGAFYDRVNLMYGSDVKNGLFYAQNSFGTATTTGKQVVFKLNGSFLRMEVTTGTVTEPEVAKTGYTFTGWCKDAECKGEKWGFTQNVNENMTLYGQSEITTYTITYEKGADDATGTIENGTKEYGKDFTLNMATYSRKGYVQVGWKGSDGKTYTGGAVYQDNADLTLTAIWEEVNSFTVPFTKTVKQSGSTKPGKATFSLYICGIEKLPSASGDIDCTGRVDIKGTGDFTGELTISGSRELVWAMLENGIYIREWDSEMDNWTYDDSVYFLRLNQYDDGYQLDVYDATAKTVGQSMVFSHGNKTVKMTFTNTYGTTTTTADSSNPKTGDNISVAVATLILSTMALVAILPRKKRI